MHLDLVPLWAVILSLAVLMYVLLDGFDLGVGILFLFRRHEPDRDLMMASVAPIWDFNETWLILGGGGLLAAFPLAFAIVIPAVYFPILIMLLGLLFRGVAFEFRHVVGARRWIWNNAFTFGSLIAAFAQGIVLGSFVQGFPVSGRVFSGTSWDWIAPFPLFTGVGLVVGYSLLGATWLYMKTESELQQWARVQSRRGVLGTLLFIAIVSIRTPLLDARIAERWFSFPNLLWLAPVPLLTLAVSWLLWRALHRQHQVQPFICAMGLFVLAYVGLIISMWPYVVPPSVTFRDAAAVPLAQQFLIVGTMFLLPVILMYVFWSYWVFRGKVRADIGYHHP